MKCQGSSGWKQQGYNSCKWLDRRCCSTPPWQGFSSCIHPEDAKVALQWYTMRRPFVLPPALGPGAHHECLYEMLDHHLAGCTLCGFVHRCDPEQVCTDGQGVCTSAASYKVQEILQGMCVHTPKAGEMHM